MSDIILSGGETSSGLVLSAGDTLSVLSGATATGTTILNGGHEIVSSGGMDAGTIISAVGFEQVSSGGTVSGAILRGGDLTIIGGTANGTTVSSGGFFVVESGGARERHGGVQPRRHRAVWWSLHHLPDGAGRRNCRGSHGLHAQQFWRGQRRRCRCRERRRRERQLSSPPAALSRSSVGGSAVGTILSGGGESVLSGGVTFGEFILGATSTFFSNETVSSGGVVSSATISNTGN